MSTSATRHRRQRASAAHIPSTAFYTKLSEFGVLQKRSEYHWQVRTEDGQFLADWWPHKGKWLTPSANRAQIGTEQQFLNVVAHRYNEVKAAQAKGESPEISDLMQTLDILLEALQEVYPLAYRFGMQYPTDSNTYAVLNAQKAIKLATGDNLEAV